MQLSVAVLSEVGETTVERYAGGSAPGPGEILVAVELSGICGSDVAAFRGTHPYKRPPAVLGHEFVGLVDAIGDGVTEHAVGDRVASASYDWCGRCGQCARGRPQLCRDKRNLSEPAMPGSFASRVLVSAKMAVEVPAVLGDEAVLVEPLAIAMHALRRVPPACRQVAVVGCGSIGLCLLAALVDRGIHAVGLDRLPARRALVEAMGAAEYCPIEEAGHLEPFDAVVLAAGEHGALDLATELVADGGAIVVVAFFPKDVAVPLTALVRREVELLTSSLCDASDLRDAVELLRRDGPRLAGMLTHRLGLGQVQEALLLASSGRPDVGKVLLEVDPEARAR